MYKNSQQTKIKKCSGGNNLLLRRGPFPISQKMYRIHNGVYMLASTALA